MKAQVKPNGSDNGHGFTSLLMYSLYAPTWTAYGKDAKVTAEVKKANGVAETTDAGSFNKLKLPDCAELSKLKSYIGMARNEFYLRCAPWGEQRGVRCGKAEEHMDLMAWFGDIQAGLEPLKMTFGAVYDSHVAKAQFLLNEMFDENDYPPVDEVLNKFQLRLSVMPLPNTSDIRVMTEIPQHVRDELEEALTAEIEKSHAATIGHAFAELYKPIAHMATTLQKYHDGEIKKLFDSVVENVRSISVFARKLNIARDETLDELAQEAEELVANLTMKDLKESDGQRVLTAQKAEALAARIAAFMP
jgi:hypothetical protein